MNTLKVKIKRTAMLQADKQRAVKKLRNVAKKNNLDANFLATEVEFNPLSMFILEAKIEIA